METQVRLATTADLRAINTIYNHYVLTCTCTYQTETATEAERLQWFSDHEKSDGRYPVIVAEQRRQIVGWGSLNPFHARAAYRFTTENSVYVHPDFQRQGIGGKLLRDLIGRADALGFRAIVAVISADQAGSIALHAGEGFIQVVRLPGVGYKFERWLDVVYMQRTRPGVV